MISYNEKALREYRSTQTPQIIPEILKCYSYSNDMYNLGYAKVAFPGINLDYIKYEYNNDRFEIITGYSTVDTFDLEIYYSGSPKNIGFGSFVFSDIENEKSVYTLNEPIFASTWFPCNDVPDDKAAECLV